MALSVNPQQQQFTRRVFIVVGIASFVILFALIFTNALYAFLLGFAAILFAVFLRGLSDLLSEHTGISKGWSLAIVSILLVLIISAAVWWQASTVIEQVQELRRTLPAAYENLKQQATRYTWGRAIIEQIPDADEIFSSGARGDSSLFSTIGGFFTSSLSIIGSLLAVTLLGVYLAVEPKIYARGFVQLFPEHRRERISDILVRMAISLRWWLIGRVFAMFIIGFFSTISLMFLNVPLALVLGLMAAFLNFIPNFGPIIALIPASLLAFTVNPLTVVYVILLFSLVQIFESYLITPMIDRKTVSLPPALTIFSQILLGYLIGILGLILAVPIVLVVIILVQNLYIEDVLSGKVDNSFSTDSLDEEAVKTADDIKE